jgi:hypothetical protein
MSAHLEVEAFQLQDKSLPEWQRKLGVVPACRFGFIHHAKAKSEKPHAHENMEEHAFRGCPSGPQLGGDGVPRENQLPFLARTLPLVSKQGPKKVPKVPSTFFGPSPNSSGGPVPRVLPSMGRDERAGAIRGNDGAAESASLCGTSHARSAGARPVR